MPVIGFQPPSNGGSLVGGTHSTGLSLSLNLAATILFSGVEGCLAGVHFNAVFCLDAQRRTHDVFRLSVRTGNMLKVRLNIGFVDLPGHRSDERSGEDIY